MGVNAGRYREKRRKTVTLPSGDVATIRKPGRESYMKLLDAQDLRDQIPIMTTEDVNPETGKVEALTPEKQKFVEQMMSIMDEVLVRCVVEPKMTLEGSEDTLAVDELDMADYFVLVKEVFEFADMSEEKIKNLFRPIKQPPGQDGGEHSSSGESEAKPNIETGTPPG